METVELHVEPREPGTKGRAKQLRRQGKIPAVFYGPKTQAIPIVIDAKEFLSRVAGFEGFHLIRLKSEAPVLAEKVALVKELQFHPVTEAILHADLFEVDLTARVHVRIPLHFEGKAAGVVRGGILQPIVREIEVECLPVDIPEHISVDVSALDIGHSLHITDVPMPAGVVAIYETDFTLVTVVPPTVEAAPPPVEAAPPAAEAAPPPAEAPGAAAPAPGKKEGAREA